jgi:hypothetical protein
MLEYGIKIIYRSGEKDTKWFADERQRDMNLNSHKAEKRIRSAKPVERKKK